MYFCFLAYLRPLMFPYFTNTLLKTHSMLGTASGTQDIPGIKGTDLAPCYGNDRTVRKADMCQVVTPLNIIKEHLESVLQGIGTWYSESYEAALGKWQLISNLKAEQKLTRWKRKRRPFQAEDTTCQGSSAWREHGISNALKGRQWLERSKRSGAGRSGEAGQSQGMQGKFKALIFIPITVCLLYLPLLTLSSSSFPYPLRIYPTRPLCLGLHEKC